MERRKKKRKKRMAERQERKKREREKNLQMRKCIQISYPFIESLSWTIKPPGTSCAKDSKGSLTSILNLPSLLMWLGGFNTTEQSTIE